MALGVQAKPAAAALKTTGAIKVYPGLSGRQEPPAMDAARRPLY